MISIISLIGVSSCKLLGKMDIVPPLGKVCKGIKILMQLDFTISVG